MVHIHSSWSGIVVTCSRTDDLLSKNYPSEFVMNHTIVRPAQVAAETRAREIASRIGLPLTTNRVEGYRFVLEVAVDQLAIRDLYQSRTRPVSINPLRPRAPGRGRDLLARATGRNCRTVFDATAGLGRDALHLAWLGRQVTAVERSPVLAELLRDAVESLELVSGVGSIKVHCGDSRLLLKELPKADVVYLDPMFPDRGLHHAAPRKELELLRGLVGLDPDAKALADLAQTCAGRRMVVKRPRSARPLTGSPDFEVPGRAIRYDVYLSGPQ